MEKQKTKYGGRSSAKSDFRAEFLDIAQGLCELLWLKIVLDDLQIMGDGLIKLYYKNRLTINIAHKSIQHDRTKHIEMIDILSRRN